MFCFPSPKIQNKSTHIEKHSQKSQNQNHLFPTITPAKNQIKECLKPRRPNKNKNDNKDDKEAYLEE